MLDPEGTPLGLLYTHVVYCGKGAVWSSHFPTRVSKTLESLLCPCESCEVVTGSGFCLLVMSPRGQDACLHNGQPEKWRGQHQHTDIKQNRAIFLLFDDMILEDLVVQGLWWFHSRRHGGLLMYEWHEGFNQEAKCKWPSQEVIVSKERQRGQTRT
jgi:hypothetical protein